MYVGHPCVRKWTKVSRNQHDEKDAKPSLCSQQIANRSFINPPDCERRSQDDEWRYQHHQSDVLDHVRGEVMSGMMWDRPDQNDRREHQGSEEDGATRGRDMRASTSIGNPYPDKGETEKCVPYVAHFLKTSPFPLKKVASHPFLSVHTPVPFRSDLLHSKIWCGSFSMPAARSMYWPTWESL